jgi:antitoxin (DNA-binding transcriptional repressor) of toxin-antitoxin stability system
MYIEAYTEGMKVTITEFRNNLFKLVERVIAGETVEFVHQGTTVRLVIPERQKSKLDRLTPRQITNPNMTESEQRAAEAKLREEMFAEMEKDWSDI